MPQDREEEMRRLNSWRDDVAHGAGGLGPAEARSIAARGLGEDAATPPEGEPECEVATGDRRDSYLEPDADQGMRARFTAGTCGPSQALQGEDAPPARPIENAAVLPNAPSAWDARPRS